MVERCLQQDAEDWLRIVNTLTPEEPRDDSPNREYFEQLKKENDEHDREAGVGQEAILAEETQRRVAACRAYTPPSEIETVDAVKFVSALHQQQRSSISRVLLDGSRVAAEATGKGRRWQAARQRALNDFRTAVTGDVSRTNSLDFGKLTVRETQSNVSGAYAFDDLPEGNYCLHADLNLPSAFAEWAIPVRVEAGKTIKVDLSSSNAILILGK